MPASARGCRFSRQPIDGRAGHLPRRAGRGRADRRRLAGSGVCAADRPFITRCEFIGGRFLYAVEVDASQGFELCPADVCTVDDGFCPTAETPAPAPKFRILDGFDHPILERHASFLEDNGIEVAGIEFIRRANGAIVTYDVNTNTNYHAQAEAAAGCFGMRELARFLGRELAAEQRRAA